MKVDLSEYVGKAAPSGQTAIEAAKDLALKRPVSVLLTGVGTDGEFDVPGMLAPYEKYIPKLDSYRKVAQALEIKTSTDDAAAVEIINTSKRAEREVVAAIDASARPYKAVVTAMGNIKRQIKEGLSLSNGIIDAKRLAFARAQKLAAEERRLKFVREQADQEAELKAKLEKIAKETGRKVDIPMPVIPPPPPVGAPAPVRTGAGTGYTRKDLVVEIEDESLIPREYLVPDMTKIKAACKTGKKIPGVKSFEQDKNVYRKA